MKYYTDDKGNYVAETDSGLKFMRGQQLPEDYYVYYDYIYFCDDKVVRSDICDTISRFRIDLIKQGLATENSVIYAGSFI